MPLRSMCRLADSRWDGDRVRNVNVSWAAWRKLAGEVLVEERPRLSDSVTASPPAVKGLSLASPKVRSSCLDCLHILINHLEFTWNLVVAADPTNRHCVSHIFWMLPMSSLKSSKARQVGRLRLAKGLQVRRVPELRFRAGGQWI